MNAKENFHKIEAYSQFFFILYLFCM